MAAQRPCKKVTAVAPPQTCFYRKEMTSSVHLLEVRQFRTHPSENKRRREHDNAQPQYRSHQSYSTDVWTMQRRKNNNNKVLDGSRHCLHRARQRLCPRFSTEWRWQHCGRDAEDSFLISRAVIVKSRPGELHSLCGFPAPIIQQPFGGTSDNDWKHEIVCNRSDRSHGLNCRFSSMHGITKTLPLSLSLSSAKKMEVETFTSHVSLRTHSHTGTWCRLLAASMFLQSLLAEMARRRRQEDGKLPSCGGH